MNEGTQIHPMHLHGMPQLVIAKDGFPLATPYDGRHGHGRPRRALHGARARHRARHVGVALPHPPPRRERATACSAWSPRWSCSDRGRDERVDLMTIYVGMDGSEGAAEAARWAVAEGKLRSTAVVAAVAWDLFSQKSLTPDGEFDPHYDENDALAVLDSWVVAAVGHEAAARVERKSIIDLPWRALVTVSEGADLLVVGARGSGGFLGLRLGSVSEKCLQHATCPVAVIHANGATAAAVGADRRRGRRLRGVRSRTRVGAGRGTAPGSVRACGDGVGRRHDRGIVDARSARRSPVPRGCREGGAR